MSGPLHLILTVLALCLRLGARKVLRSSKLMRSFGLNIQKRLADFFFATHSPDLLQVRLVILISIDPPIAPNPTFPRITVQLWRVFGLQRPSRSTSSAFRTREARIVWTANWTVAVTPFYILLDDIFRGNVPPEYGNNDRVYLDTVGWRQRIITAWS